MKGLIMDNSFEELLKAIKTVEVNKKYTYCMFIPFIINDSNTYIINGDRTYQDDIYNIIDIASTNMNKLLIANKFNTSISNIEVVINVYNNIVGIEYVMYHDNNVKLEDLISVIDPINYSINKAIYKTNIKISEITDNIFRIF